MAGVYLDRAAWGANTDLWELEANTDIWLTEA
jgi:hypothetical protein